MRVNFTASFVVGCTSSTSRRISRSCSVTRTWSATSVGSMTPTPMVGTALTSSGAAARSPGRDPPGQAPDPLGHRFGHGLPLVLVLDLLQASQLLLERHGAVSPVGEVAPAGGRCPSTPCAGLPP